MLNKYQNKSLYKIDITACFNKHDFQPFLFLSYFCGYIIPYDNHIIGDPIS